MKSIKTQLITFLGVLVLVVSLGLGIISYFSSRNALQSNVEKTIPKIADEGAKLVESRIETKLKSLEVLAENENIKNKDTELNKQLQILKGEQKRQGYIHIGIADKSGNSIIEDGKPIDIKDRDYFKKAISGELAVSDPIVSKADNNIIVAFGVPIKNNNEIIGVLYATYDGNILSNITNDITFGETGKAFMLKKDGTTIAHTNKELVLNMDNDFENVKKDPKLIPLVEVEKKMVAGEEGTGQYTYDGVVKYVGYAPVKSTGWSLAVVIEKKEVLSELSTLQILQLVSSVVFLIIGIIVLYFIANKIVKRIKRVSVYLESLSKGDFSEEVSSEYITMKDEIGEIARSVKNMRDSVREMIYSIKENASNIDANSINLSSVAEEISVSSQSIATAIQDVSNGTSGQAEDLVDITGVLEQFSNNLENIIQSIKEVDVNSKEVGSMAGSSSSDMEMLVQSVNKVDASFKEFANKILGLGENITKINEITNVINSISDQTNLLALNAAIEAARAGEAGRGFAVVADEIRKLAEQSKSSSVDISKLISEISVNTNTIVDNTGEMSQEIVSQISLISNSITSFKGIISGINSIIPKIENINKSTLVIDEEKNDILQKVENISAVAEETSASSEEIAASTEEMNASTEEVAASSQMLSNMTSNMMQQVNKFKL